MLPVVQDALGDILNHPKFLILFEKVDEFKKVAVVQKLEFQADEILEKEGDDGVFALLKCSSASCLISSMVSWPLTSARV
jgi:hypothetical protein